jgi:nicotinate-nucleotide adenylyltransferase
MTYKRVALFGGTFDPIHKGHTTVAMDAAKRLAVERLIFVPAKQSPLKSLPPKVTDEARVAMIRLALEDYSLLSLHTCELERTPPSYTLDTILFFREIHGKQATLFWLMGADGVTSLPHWYRIGTLMEQCTLVTLVRGGCPPPDYSCLVGSMGPNPVKKLQEYVLQTPDVPISSTEIRTRLANNQDVEELLDPKVLNYIRAHRLYR